MRLRGWGGLVLAVVIAVMLVLPLVVKSSFALEMLIRVLLFAFIGTAWNLLGGYAKQLSLGHAAFFGLGAYTSTVLQIDLGHLALDRHGRRRLGRQCSRACRSAGCVFACAGPISPSPPSRPRRC